MELETGGSSHETTEEDADLFRRSKRRNKDNIGSGNVEYQGNSQADSGLSGEGRGKASYRDSLVGRGMSTRVYGSALEEVGGISDDDPIKEGGNGSWFSMGMTRAEKIKARRSWWNSLIITLVGRPIGYHYL